MTRNSFTVLDFVNDKLVFIDQTKLPLVEEYIETDSYERIADAIEKLEIRGAPAIGVAAAYALALSIKKVKTSQQEEFEKAYQRLASTRPTAVNLFWALNEIKGSFQELNQQENSYNVLVKRAKEIHQHDIEMCERIGLNGLKIFKKRCNVLTHCNAGKLATSGEGTALNVIKKGFENNFVKHVYADETRPLLQGSRLTAFELDKEGIPFSIITDSTAAFLMQQGKIDLVVVGADRIARNGDTANKVGTYNLAVACSFHKIPFYIAAPVTTVDKHCNDGSEILIEERNKKELTHFGDKQITNEDYPVYSPAFDVTPASLITGIITDKEIFCYPYHF
ncbi:MAG: S-methyl-5-thioribose-1-phosphate isomerase [Ignavibacteriales bacterium]|nr:S-methyl-5-thioribose-1-phosphate isomerase [Ignavibacteriales bacterium]